MTTRIALLLILLMLGAAPAALAQAGSQDTSVPAGGEAVLSQLFNRLQATKDDSEAQVIEQAIWHYWINKGTDTVDILMGKGMRAMQSGDHDSALSAFDAVIVLDPTLAEGYNKRATVYYMMGRYTDSVQDIERTLDIEPRHFGALSGLGLIYVELENDEAALRAFEKALEINPHMQQIEEKAQEIRLKLRGQGI